VRRQRPQDLPRDRPRLFAQHVFHEAERVVPVKRVRRAALALGRGEDLDHLALGQAADELAAHVGVERQEVA
jgi:hypothetical protein